jgi:hypothetical protein
LIFGANVNQGFMPSNNTDIPGQASYFFWNGSSWQNGGGGGKRFVVRGAPVAGGRG